MSVIIIFWLCGALLSTSAFSSMTRTANQRATIEPRSTGSCSVSYEILPEFCKQYYGNATAWMRLNNVTVMEALSSVNTNTLSNTSFSETLLETVQRHLCYYYYPLCDAQTDAIISLCNGNCLILNDNTDYSTVISEVADELVSFDVEPPDDKCFKTFNEQSENIPISQFCVRTEGTIEDSIGVSCTAIPRDEPCSNILNTTYYTPNVTVITESNFRNIITLIEAIEISESCETLTSVLLCAYSFPPCDFNASQLLPICPERCLIIDQLFEVCRQFVNNQTLQLIPVLRPLLEMFNCSNPLTYFNVPPEFISKTMCSDLVEDGILTSVIIDNSDDDGDLSGGIIAGVITGAVILFSILIISAIIICRKVFFQPMGDSEKVNSTAVSMSSPSQCSQPQESNCCMQKETMTSTEIDQFLEMVKKTFSDVLLPVEYISKQEFLGKGAFGVVHKGEFVVADGSILPIAIKTIKSSSLNSLRDLVAETAIMKNFDHPNVLQLLGVCVDISNDDGSMLKVILPFMSNGDLRSFLRRNRIEQNNIQHFPKSIDKFGLTRMCIDIAKGMQYLSMKRFVHRDLAARNCMVDMHLSIRVADFGLTRDIYSSEYYRADKHTTLPVKWMAIESLLDGYFDEKTDVWSYGITCWEIFTLGRIPYPGVDNHNVITILKNGQRLDKPILCPPKLYSLIQLTWLESPGKRPSFAEIAHKLNQCTLF